MVEFAIILPVFLLLLLMAIDFGRVFFSTIQLSNAVREAADYGANNPVDVQGMLARANRRRGAQSQGGQQDALVFPTNISTTAPSRTARASRAPSRPAVAARATR